MLFTGLKELPKPPRAAIILTKGMGAMAAIEEAAANGIKKIWLQGDRTPGNSRALHRTGIGDLARRVHLDAQRRLPAQSASLLP